MDNVTVVALVHIYVTFKKAIWFNTKLRFCHFPDKMPEFTDVFWKRSIKTSRASSRQLIWQILEIFRFI